MNLSESYKKRLQELAGIIDENLNFISKQEASDRKLFGPVYHGAPQEKLDKIQSQGFKVFVGAERNGEVSHGYSDLDYYNGDPPPIHHLGYGVYFTTVKDIAKKFNAGTTKGLKEYYLDAPKLEIINFGSPKNMMRWWLDNGYDAYVAEKDRVEATKMLTDVLKSKYDAVWFKGKGIKRLLDGDQIVVFDPSRIYQIDQTLSKELEIGSSVISTVDFANVAKGAIGTINSKKEAQSMRDFWVKSNNSPHWTNNSKYVYDITFKKGGRQFNVLDDMIEPYKKKSLNENREIDKLLDFKKDLVKIDDGHAHAELGTEQLAGGEPTIYISEIWSDIKGKGYASKLLNKLKNFSLKRGFPLSLRASVTNNIKTSGGLGQEQLVNWYLKNGFKISEEDNNFETDPSAPFMTYNY